MKNKNQTQYQTSDGMRFYKDTHAKAHASTLKDKNVEPVTKVITSAKKSAEERIEHISKLTTVDEVNEALEGETAKTVLAAGKQKIEELTKED